MLTATWLIRAWKAELPRICVKPNGKGIDVFVQGGVGPEDWRSAAALEGAVSGKILTALDFIPGGLPSERGGSSTGPSQFGKRIGEADALGETGLDHAPRIPDGRPIHGASAFEASAWIYSRGLQSLLVLHVVRAHESAFR